MPTTVNVKVNTVNHTTQTSKAGNDLNYVEITGFDATNSKGFKKRFFATKKDGTATKNAETADALSQDDWIAITLDDTSFANVQTLKKISEPAGMSAPSQASAESGNPKGKGTGGGGSKKTKGEFRTVPQLNREVALNAAVKLAGDTAVGDMDTVLANAKEFETFLVGTPEPAPKDVAANGNTFVNAPPGSADVNPNQPQDDDIPF